MTTASINQEAFSISFNGVAFEKHDISAIALGQSLIALDGLARRATELVYGKSSAIDVKVKSGFQQGSFLVDLIIEHPDSSIYVAAGAVTILTGVIQLARWAFGKKVRRENETDKSENISIKNEVGNILVANQSVVNFYMNSRTQSQLSRLTQTLDMPGAESISIRGESDESAQIITQEERRFFRQDEGLVLTDNEREVVLIITSSRLNGSSEGWCFSEDEDSEFTATVEDESFLEAVKRCDYSFVHGTSALVVLRTVQRKLQRTRTDRTIVEVKEIYPPE